MSRYILELIDHDSWIMCIDQEAYTYETTMNAFKAMQVHEEELDDLEWLSTAVRDKDMTITKVVKCL